MCCEYWCFCFDPKPGSIVIAYFSGVVYIISHVLSCIWLVFFITPLIMERDRTGVYKWVYVDVTVNWVGFVIIMTATHKLLQGLKKNKPQQIKMYIMSAAAFIVLNTIEFFYLALYLGGLTIILNCRVVIDIVLGIYTLLVIASYYKMIKNNEEINGNALQQNQEFV